MIALCPICGRWWKAVESIAFPGEFQVSLHGKTPPNVSPICRGSTAPVKKEDLNVSAPQCDARRLR